MKSEGILYKSSYILVHVVDTSRIKTVEQQYVLRKIKLSARIQRSFVPSAGETWNKGDRYLWEKEEFFFWLGDYV